VPRPLVRVVTQEQVKRTAPTLGSRDNVLVRAMMPLIRRRFHQTQRPILRGVWEASSNASAPATQLDAAVARRSRLRSALAERVEIVSDLAGQHRLREPTRGRLVLGTL
jgi:hypothetical protein